MYIFYTFYYPRRELCPVSFYYCRLEYSYFQRLVLLYRGFITWVYAHIKSPEIIPKFSSLSSSVLQIQNVTYFLSCLTVKELIVWALMSTRILFFFHWGSVAHLLCENDEIIWPLWASVLQGVVGNKWYMYVNISASVPSTQYDTINSTYYIVRTIYIVAFKDWQYSRISESFIILMYWT